WGQLRYAMRLWIAPMKLASYGLTVADVRAALLAQNIELPSGKLTGDATELSVKTLGNLNTEEEFNSIIILADGEKLVQLRDIGRASLEGENMENKMSDSGQPVVAVAVVPQPGTNYLDISTAFDEEYDKLQKELPEDFKLNVVIDDTVFVKRAVTEVAETILIS